MLVNYKLCFVCAHITAFCCYRIMVSTQDFHSCNPSSILGGSTTAKVLAVQMFFMVLDLRLSYVASAACESGTSFYFVKHFKNNIMERPIGDIFI